MENETEILAAADALRNGQLVAFPTETVYGLGANAFDAQAVAGIFELKGRPRFDPLIVHVAEPDDVEKISTPLPPVAKQLVEKFWPGPLSLVVKKLSCIPDIVTAGLPNVAIRCPVHNIARRLIRAAGVPIAAPSANRFGMVSPTTKAHVADQFGNQLPWILDGGPCEIGVESTVISFAGNNLVRPILLRHGGVTQEQIESITGPIEIRMHEDAHPSSPGQLSRHYSPRTPFVLAAKNGLYEHTNKEEKVGLISFKGPPNPDFFSNEILSADGNLTEAAANLFAAMRQLDEQGLDLIVAEPVPEIGLGRAIMDRLRRAAAR